MSKGIHTLQYKSVYKPAQFRPEFLEWYGKRQAELIMQIRKIDGDMAMAEIEARYRPVYVPSLLPILVPFGAIIGALVGLLIVSSL